MMNLRTKFRLQMALTLVVAGALPQLAHAGGTGPLATDAHDRAPAQSAAASHYTPQALRAMGARYQAMADAYAKRSRGTAAATSVPKSSPYYYGGNVAPVTTKQRSDATASVPESSPYYYGGNVAPVTTKPSAHATTRQYDVGGTLVSPDVPPSVRPDDRAAARGADPAQPVVAVTPDPSGFDWGDATIGAAGGAGAALLLIGATLIAMLGRRQRVATQ
jgi:hypothetical protein